MRDQSIGSETLYNDNAAFLAQVESATADMAMPGLAATGVRLQAGGSDAYRLIAFPSGSSTMA